jgi:hypothetical protein
MGVLSIYKTHPADGALNAGTNSDAEVVILRSKSPVIDKNAVCRVDLSFWRLHLMIVQLGSSYRVIPRARC